MNTIKSALGLLGQAVRRVLGWITAVFAWWVGKIKGSSSRKAGCAWLFGGLFVVFCGCSFLLLLTPGGRESMANTRITRTAVAIATQEAPTQTSTSLPTSTSTSTPTEIPTSTPIRPSLTPTPLTASPTSAPRTPTATRASTPTPTVEAEQAYLDKMAEIAGVYIEALSGLERQFVDATESTSLFSDQEWVIQTASYVAIMRLNNDDARAVVPPDLYLPAHAYAIEAADHYDASMDALLAGIDNLDIAKMTEASTELDLGNQALDNASAAITAIRSGESVALPTAVPQSTNTSVPLSTAVPLPSNTPALLPTSPPPTTAPQPTATAAPAAASVVILAVNKSAEFVDIQNTGGAAQDLTNWRLVSETGNQSCTLGGVLQPGQVLRIYALAEDVGLGGFNCGFGGPIWNNSESDPAALYDENGNLVDRW